MKPKKVDNVGRKYFYPWLDQESGNSTTQKLEKAAIQLPKKNVDEGERRFHHLMPRWSGDSTMYEPMTKGGGNPATQCQRRFCYELTDDQDRMTRIR